MARLPLPVPPPRRRIDRADAARLDDEESLAKTVVRTPAFHVPRAAVAATLGAACVIAAFTGVLLGHARPSHAHANVPAQTAQTGRTPRVAVVVEANEEITQHPVLAPGKTIDTPVEEATAKVARPLRRAGFGHLGADRVGSGAAARRAAPHRH
ncbi:MAG: hypothetical protein JWO86_4960 [Myxococcaceae bacterium]|nr:hypothetical protein [Myxococcaceae bacterium]